jgi:hypothetical protein
MDIRELRAKALHHRRTAQLVSDQAIAQALDELATEYDSLADRLEEEAKHTGAAQQ